MGEDEWSGRERRSCPIAVCNKPTEAAEEAADNAVRKVFLLMEINIDDPKDLKRFRESLRLGEYMTSVAKRSLAGFFITLVTTVAMGLVYLAFGRWK